MHSEYVGGPGNKHFPLLPYPLTDEWQLFKCKLSLTNTTPRDTCFNHGNKGAASGRAGAPFSVWYSNDGAVQQTKTRTSKNSCAGRGICCTMCLLPPPPLISFIFKVIKAEKGWKSLNHLPRCGILTPRFTSVSCRHFGTFSFSCNIYGVLLIV